MSENDSTLLDELVTGLALADGPAFRGDLARVLDRDSDAIRRAVEQGLAEEALYLTGQNQVALVNTPDDEAIAAALDDDEVARLRRRWMRVHRFRSWAQEQVTKSSRTGVGVVFTDEIHILPNAALCRLVDDWSSPEMWFRDLLGQKQTPEPRTCPSCGSGELLGDSLVDIEAPTGHEKTFSVTFYGHCHPEGGEDRDEPPLLFAVRLREERAPEPSAHPVLGGSTSDTGLDLALSFPDYGQPPDHAPGEHTLENVLARTDRLHERLEGLAGGLDEAGAEGTVRGELDEILETTRALRADVRYRREMMRLTSTVRTLRAIFDSKWTYEDAGRRTVSALGAVVDVDEIVLLIHEEGEAFEVLGRLGEANGGESREFPDDLSSEESALLERVVARGGVVELSEDGDGVPADDPLRVGGSVLALPVEHGGTAVGVLVAGRDEDGGFGRVDRQFFRAVVNPLGEVLSNLDSGAPFKSKTGIDDVTGVFNQTRFFDNAAREFVQARAEGRDLSALVFSVDDWDRISQGQNTTATDEILRTVVSRAAEALRGSDFVGRYAQATFTAMLVDVDAEIARKVANRIRAAIADEPINLGGAELPVTVSVGAAEKTPELTSADRLVNRADSAMMKASGDGGDRVEIAG